MSLYYLRVAIFGIPASCVATIYLRVPFAHNISNETHNVLMCLEVFIIYGATGMVQSLLIWNVIVLMLSTFYKTLQAYKPNHC